MAQRDHAKAHEGRKRNAAKRAAVARSIGIDVAPDATPAQLRRILDRVDAVSPGTKERFTKSLKPAYGRGVRVGAPRNKGERTETTKLGGGGRHVETNSEPAILRQLRRANPREKVVVRATFQGRDGRYKTKDLVGHNMANAGEAGEGGGRGGQSGKPASNIEMTFGPQANEGLYVEALLDFIDSFDDVYEALYALWEAEVSP